MSNEIQISTQLKLSNALLSMLSTPALLVQQINQAVQAGDGHMVTLVAGTDTAIAINASVTTLGWAWFINLDPTNYVQWGPDNSGAINPMGRMQPGEPAGPFRLEPGITFRMKAHTGNCNVFVLVLAN